MLAGAQACGRQLVQASAAGCYPSAASAARKAGPSRAQLAVERGRRESSAASARWRVRGGTASVTGRRAQPAHAETASEVEHGRCSRARRRCRRAEARARRHGRAQPAHARAAGASCALGNECGLCDLDGRRRGEWSPANGDTVSVISVAWTNGGAARAAGRTTTRRAQPGERRRAASGVSAASKNGGAASVAWAASVTCAAGRTEARRA